MSNRILRLKPVTARVGLAKSTLYKLIANDNFPKPIKLGARAVGWLESDIDAWLELRIKLSAVSTDISN